MSKNGKNGSCVCNNLGPAARPMGLAGNGGAYVVTDSRLIHGIDNQAIAGLGQDAMRGGYTPGLGGLFDIDMKPFLLLGAAYLAYRVLIKKHG